MEPAQGYRASCEVWRTRRTLRSAKSRLSTRSRARAWKSFRLSARRIHRGRPDGLILLAIEDITDRKRAAEEKYRRLFEAAQDGIIIIDAESGEITDANPFILDLLGFNRGDLIGKRFWEKPPLAACAGARSALDRLREKEVVRFPDIAVKARDGRKIEMEVVGNIYHEGTKRWRNSISAISPSGRIQPATATNRKTREPGSFGRGHRPRL